MARAVDSMHSTISSVHSGSSSLIVVLPNKNNLIMTFGLNYTGQDVVNKLSELLGTGELCLFGLHLKKDNEPIFLDLEKKLTTYFPKTQKQNTQLKDEVVLHLKIQYHVGNGCLIVDEKARMLYYSDLKDKVKRCQCYEQEGQFFQLSAYALQADLGDWCEGEAAYFNPQDYFPPWILLRRGCDYIKRHTPELHRELVGIPSAEAILLFIQEASRLNDVMITFYRMKKEKKEQKDSVSLGVTLTGLHVYELVDGERHFLNEFVWSSIDRLSFKGRRFEIQADVSGSKLVLFTRSALHSEHLLKHISNSHRVHLNTKLSGRDLQLYQNKAVGRRCREVYITHSTDPDTNSESEDELPRLKSYLNRTRLRHAAVSSSRAGVSKHASAEYQFRTSADSYENELCVDEPEEMFVDGPDEVIYLTELLVGVSVDGPVFLPVPQWIVEMKDVLKRRASLRTAPEEV